MKTSSDTLFWLEFDLARQGIEHGYVDAEALLQAKEEYEAFLQQLEEEWPAERIKAHVVEHRRKQYVSTKAYIEKLENQNRDARVQGVSYAERKPTSDKIALGQKVLADIVTQGNEAKRATYGVRYIVQPTDMPRIQEKGFEHHLNNTLCWP